MNLTIGNGIRHNVIKHESSGVLLPFDGLGQESLGVCRLFDYVVSRQKCDLENSINECVKARALA